MAANSELLKRAREQARITQGELARRLGVTQGAVAQLESRRANPTIATLERALHATGHSLRLDLVPLARGVDETLLREALRLTPAERIAAAARLQADAEAIAAAGRSARGQGRRAKR